MWTCRTCHDPGGILKVPEDMHKGVSRLVVVSITPGTLERSFR